LRSNRITKRKVVVVQRKRIISIKASIRGVPQVAGVEVPTEKSISICTSLKKAILMSQIKRNRIEFRKK